FEIEGVGDRPPHPPILEYRTPDVVDKSLHAGGNLVLDRLLLDEALGDGGGCVRGGPVLGAVLLAEVVLATLEGLERDCGVAVVVEAGGIEVVAAEGTGRPGSPDG